jgi:hypothetical protein
LPTTLSFGRRALAEARAIDVSSAKPLALHGQSGSCLLQNAAVVSFGDSQENRTVRWDETLVGKDR